jgi:hypothetical protein
MGERNAGDRRAHKATADLFAMLRMVTSKYNGALNQ